MSKNAIKYRYKIQNFIKICPRSKKLLMFQIALFSWNTLYKTIYWRKWIQIR